MVEVKSAALERTRVFTFGLQCTTRKSDICCTSTSADRTEVGVRPRQPTSPVRMAAARCFVLGAQCCVVSSTTTTSPEHSHDQP